MFRSLNGDLAGLLQIRLYRRAQVPDSDDLASTFRRPVERNLMASQPRISRPEVDRNSNPVRLPPSGL